MLPCVQCDEAHWINWWSPPPAAEKTAMPAVIENKLGDGRVYYCAFDLFSKAADETYQLCNQLFPSLLHTAPQAPAHVEQESPDVVRNAFTVKPDGTCNLHQISQMAKRFGGKACTVSGGSLVLPKAGDQAPQVFQVYPESKPLTVTEQDGSWTVKLPDLLLQQIIQFK